MVCCRLPSSGFTVLAQLCDPMVKETENGAALFTKTFSAWTLTFYVAISLFESSSSLPKLVFLQFAVTNWLIAWKVLPSWMNQSVMKLCVTADTLMRSSEMRLGFSMLSFSRSTRWAVDNSLPSDRSVRLSRCHAPSRRRRSWFLTSSHYRQQNLFR